jgi:cytochrome b
VDNNNVADDGSLTHVVPAMVLNLIIDLHRMLWDALLAAVALHVMTIAIYAVAKGQNLPRLSP